MSDQQSPEAITVASVVAIQLDQLASLAWARMGLQPDPYSGKMDKDLEQAKLAVDAAAALAKLLDTQLDENDQRQVRNLIRDLQMNYLDQEKGARS